MRAALLALVLAAPAHAWEATALPPGAAAGGTPLDLSVQGAVDPRPGGGFASPWPGIVAAARFEGDAVVARFDDAEGRYQLTVDGAPGPAVTRPGRGGWRLDGLGPGPHTVTVEKVGEGAGAFAGFAVPPGGRPLPPPPAAARQIEVIGDSDSVGYGILSATRACPGGAAAASDSRRTYGPALAARYRADLRLVARSGIGIVRNYAGSPGPAMAEAWPATPADPGWTPELVVVALGSNDFAVDLAPGEPWPDAPALAAAYTAGLERLLAAIRDRHPQASILVMRFDDYDGDYVAATNAAADARSAAGDTRVALAAFPKLARTACDWHPSAGDHAAMADALAGAIDAMPDVWEGR